MYEGGGHSQICMALLSAWAVLRQKNTCGLPCCGCGALHHCQKAPRVAQLKGKACSPRVVTFLHDIFRALFGSTLAAQKPPKSKTPYLHRLAAHVQNRLRLDNHRQSNVVCQSQSSGLTPIEDMPLAQLSQSLASYRC